MPATSIRDLVFKDDDVVVGTHGRSFWILDDIAPLRQMTATEPTVLYKPAPAIRVRWDMWPDTPLPGDEPGGENPPDGAAIDYYVKEGAAGPVTLDISDARGRLVRHFASTDTMYTIPDVNIPTYWIRPQQVLSSQAGPHRMIWDLHYQPLNVPAEYPIGAIYANTAPAATSPWAMPGVYTVKLTVNGKTYTQPLTVRMDPRVKTPLLVLQQQHDLALQAYKGRQAAMQAYDEVRGLRSELATLLQHSSGAFTTALQDLDAKAAQLEGAGGRRRGAASSTKVKTFGQLQGDYTGVFSILEGADEPPTTQVIDGLKATEMAAAQTMAAWKQIQEKDLPALNAQLKAAGLDLIKIK
jgi:hypothetical protein